MRQYLLRILLLLLLSGCSLAFVIRPDRVAFVATDNDAVALEPRPTQETLPSATPIVFATATLAPTAWLPTSPICITRAQVNLRSNYSLTSSVRISIPSGKEVYWLQSGKVITATETWLTVMYILNNKEYLGYIVQRYLDCED